MKKGTKKVIGVGIGILLVVVCLYLTDWRLERIRVTGLAADIVIEYRDYYQRASFMRRGLPMASPFGGFQYRNVFFSPGQKEKMLEKIREDVSAILDTLIKENSDIFYKYEISYDFKNVRIYET